MTTNDIRRLHDLRKTIKKWMVGETILKRAGCSDISRNLGWVPSESEAAFFLRIIDLKNSEIRRLKMQISAKQ